MKDVDILKVDIVYKKKRKLLNLCNIIILILLFTLLGVFSGALIVQYKLNVPIERQVNYFKIYLNGGNVVDYTEEEKVYMLENVDLGEIKEGNKVTKAYGIKVKEVVSKNDYYYNAESKTPNSVTDYTLADYYITNVKVEPYDVFYYYGVNEEDTNSVYSMIAYNSTNKAIDAEDCTVIGIGYDKTKGIKVYTGIEYGVLHSTVDIICKDMVNISNTEGYATYIDTEDNFIRLAYEDGEVVSVFTGNTFKEKEVIKALKK